VISPDDEKAIRDLGRGLEMAVQSLGSIPSLVGTWELISFTSRLADGSSKVRWPDSVGRITYDADGNVTGLLMSGRRNEADGSSSPAEAEGEFTAYFGRYHVDVAQGLITHRVIASLSAPRASGELLRTYELRDGLLTLGFPAIRNGVSMTNLLVWKRISPNAL